MKTDLKLAIQRAYPTGRYRDRERYQERGTWRERDMYVELITPGYRPWKMMKRLEKRISTIPGIVCDDIRNWDKWPDMAKYDIDIFPSNFWDGVRKRYRMLRRYLMSCEISMITPYYICRWFFGYPAIDGYMGGAGLRGCNHGRWQAPSKFWASVEGQIRPILEAEGLQRIGRDALTEPVSWVKPDRDPLEILSPKKYEGQIDGYCYYPARKLTAYHCLFL